MTKEETLAKVGDQGRVTIPKAIRDVLGIDEGDIVRVTVCKVE